MKIAITIISALLLVWAVVFYMFGAQINTVYLCSYMDYAIENQPEDLSVMERQQYIAESVSHATYSPTLRRMFGALAELSGPQRGEILQEGLQEIMGEGYTCPSLNKIFVGIPMPEEDY